MILRPQKISKDALKDLLGETIKELMESELDQHLGYKKSERSNQEDYRNGYKTEPSTTKVSPFTIPKLIHYITIS